MLFLALFEGAAIVTLRPGGLWLVIGGRDMLDHWFASQGLTFTTGKRRSRCNNDAEGSRHPSLISM